MGMFSTSNTVKPAPKWFRITKKIWSNTENLVIGILLVTGHTDSSLPLLVFKLCSSFLKDTLESVMSNGEEYAPVGATEALENATGQPAAQAIKSNT